MKKTGTCPKCGSREIYTDEGLIKRGDRSSIPVTNWRRILVSTYICSRCGFLEEYIGDADLNDSGAMQKLREKWKRAN